MPELLNIEVQLEPRVRNISVDVESQLQDIEVGICSSFIYAFSPTAKVEELPNGNYLITITDKYGTTTAEVPVVNPETINEYIENYLKNNPIIIQQLIKEAEDYQELYNELKELIQNAIDVSVPAEPDGSININGTNYQVYELPEQVVTTDDFLIIDCLDAGAESSGEPGESIPQQATDRVGNGIEDVVFNDDYTLTIFFTDGTSYTTPAIRGAKGDTGNGIANVTMNNNSTLTFVFTDGSIYTTPSLKGLKGDTGKGILNTVLNNDYTLTITFTDGTSYTTPSIRGPKGSQGDPGKGIINTTLNNDYTLTLNYSDGSSYTTSSIRGEKGQTGAVGPKGQKGNKGDPGERGQTGPRGQKGDKGDTGQTGAPGQAGATGPQGPKGQKGDTGQQGPKGDQGQRGPQGQPGTNMEIHICSFSEYDSETRMPTIEDADSSTFYLVPTSDGSSPDLFTEWVYVNNNWEIFGNTRIDLSGYLTDVTVDGNSVVIDGVAEIPIASVDAGVVKINPSFGIGIYDGQLLINGANANDVKNGTASTKAVNAYRQHESVFYGLAKAAGHDERNSTLALGTYSDEAKAAIQTMLDVPSNADVVNDVQVNGTSVVTNGVAEIPVASGSAYGVAKVSGAMGVEITNGFLTMSSANSNYIQGGEHTRKAITPKYQHESTFYGLAKASGDTTQSQSSNPVGTYTDEAKESIQNMLNVPDKDYVAGIDFSDRIAKGVDSEDNVVDGALIVGQIEDTVDANNNPVPKNIASGVNSIALGRNTVASGNCAVSSGILTRASGNRSFTKGGWTHASGSYSSAEGLYTIACGYYSHAEGRGGTYQRLFSGDANVTEYITNQLVKIGSCVVETLNDVIDDNVIIVIDSSERSDGTYVARLNKTLSENEAISNKQYYLILNNAIGYCSHVEGANNSAFGDATHVEGGGNIATGQYSHAEGSNTKSIGSCSHTEGQGSIAFDYNSHAEGSATRAVGSVAHTEGTYTIGLGKYSHSENNHTLAAGRNSHAENASTVSYGEASHAEGKGYWLETTITGNANATVYTYATNEVLYPNSIIYIEDYAAVITAVDTVNKTITVSSSLVKECNNTTARIYFSSASGFASHVEGGYTIAGSDYQHVQGKYNIVDTNNVYADIVGGGTDFNNRKNIYTLDWSGNETLAGGITLGKDTQNETSLSATELKALKDLDPVNDVQVNGTSIVSDGVANVPIAGASTFGTVKVRIQTDGLFVDGNGLLNISASDETFIKAGTNGYRPIVPSRQHLSTFYGLAKAAGSDEKNSTLPVGQYTENAKSAINTMLNAPVTVTGTTPTITAKSGIQYICGEVATLDITLPESGIVDVVFTSGSTPTVLTITPQTGQRVRWANGFDATSLDANTTYEVNFLNGMGVACSWT